MSAAAAPRLSIIVPVHGDPAYLGEALHSIRVQQAGPSEVIVVDDGCTVPLGDIVRAILPEALILEQANAGPAAARNRGLRAARGDYVAFLDADDRWTDWALAFLAKGFVDAPRADVVQGHVRRFGDTGPAGPGRRRGLEQPYLGFNVGAMLARRQALLAAGLFDETLRMSEDVDLFMRLHDQGLRRLTIPDIVLEYRRHPGSVTATTPPRVVGRGAGENWIRLLHRSRARRAAVPASPADAVPANAAPAAYSVVMVVKDGRRYLPQALACVRAQSVAPAEIVAVVGASDDGTLAYLQEQPDVRVVAQAGSGLAAARNQGIAEARQAFVAFLDHDDLWKPRKVEMQLAMLGLFDRPAACITAFRLFRDVEGSDPARVVAAPGQLPRLGWTPSALVAHRELFRTVGAFDPAAGIGCDTDWFRRLQLSGAPCAVASGALLEKRIHADNLSRDAARNRAAMFQVLHKHRTEQRGR